MLDPIVEALYRESLRACPPERTYRLADLRGDILSDPLRRYAADLLQDAAASELAENDPGSLRWVEMDPEVRSAHEAFVARCLDSAVAPQEEWAELLRRAAQRTVDFTVRPRAGLVAAVFEGAEGPLDPASVIERISRFHSGLALRAAVVRGLKKSGVGKLDEAAFRALVNRVHDAMTLDHERAEWQKDISPLREVLSAAGFSESVPTAAAAELLKDLGNTAVADEFSSRHEENVLWSELLDILAGPEADEPETKAAVTDTTAPATTEPDKPLPLWQRFQENLNQPIGVPAARSTPDSEKRSEIKPPDRSPAARPRDGHAAEEEESQKPLWQRFRAVRDPEIHDESISDLEIAILGGAAGRGREAFLSSLFDGDEETYADVLSRLSRTRSWSEASRVIAEDVFKRFQVNIYSDEAVAFTNAVEARFRVKEASG